MALLKKAHLYLGLAGAVATILTLLLTGFTTFFPGKVNEFTSSLTGPIDRNPTGTIRAVYVTNQVKVFFYVSAVVVLLAGASMGTAYHWSAAASASSVAAGRGKVRWLKFATISFPVALTVVLGVYLPRAVFQPTNEEELGRQFFLGAWALRSWLGGLVMGVTYVAIAGIIAYIGLVLFVQIRRSLQLGKYQRQLEG